MSAPILHDYAAIAAVANAARLRREPMSNAVAAHVGCTTETAKSLIRRARTHGHDIPAPLPRPRTDYPHGTTSRYRTGCHCADCRRAKREFEQARRGGTAPTRTLGSARTARPFTPPQPTGRPHACTDCGHTAPTGWELAAHTLERHGRTLVATERTPLTEENAAA